MSMNKEEVKSKPKNNKYTCVICGGEFIGYGHSAIPISDKGVCCDSCNNKVIIERLKQWVINNLFFWSALTAFGFVSFGAIEPVRLHL